MKAVLFWLLMAVSLPLHAEYIDLSKGDGEDGKQGGMLVTDPYRCDEERPLVCVIVAHKDDVYLVAIDAKGEYRITILKENNERHVIWSRESI